jgi:hypothetical protein
MAVFSVKTEKMSEEEIKQYQLSHEDFIWWADNLPRLTAVKENRGKFIAVVNREPFFGKTYEEAEANAMAKYPNRRFAVHRIPNREGKRI